MPHGGSLQQKTIPLSSAYQQGFLCLEKRTIFACPAKADASGSWQAYWITAVRLEEDREWNGEAQFLRGLEVDHHDQLRRELYRQVTRRGAVQDFVHERGCWTAYLK